MKTDLDSLMQTPQSRRPVGGWPRLRTTHAMVYLTGGAHMTDAILIKPRGAAPVLVPPDHGARRSGQVGTAHQEPGRIPPGRAAQAIRRRPGQRHGARYLLMFKDAGVTSGRVAIYGQSDAGTAFTIFSALQKPPRAGARRRDGRFGVVGSHGHQGPLRNRSHPQDGEDHRVRGGARPRISSPLTGFKTRWWSSRTATRSPSAR